jgi:hypothetical protein
LEQRGKPLLEIGLEDLVFGHRVRSA